MPWAGPDSHVPWAAISTIARADLRRRRRALVALGLIAGLVGGVVLAIGVTARRTGTAYSRLEAATGVDDARVMVYTARDDAGKEVTDRIAGLESVRRAWVGGMAVGRLEGAEVNHLGVLTGPPRPADLFAPVVVTGRMYSNAAPDEVVVTEQFSRQTGIRPGNRGVCGS